MAINARLRTVADFVCGGALVVDVGCDHAILPIELVRKNKVGRVIACDIGEGPLASATATLNARDLKKLSKLAFPTGLIKFCPTRLTIS